MNPIEKLILKETEGLPPFALNEVLDFILFIKEKKLKKNDRFVADTMALILRLERSRLG